MAKAAVSLVNNVRKNIFGLVYPNSQERALVYTDICFIVRVELRAKGRVACFRQILVDITRKRIELLINRPGDSAAVYQVGPELKTCDGHNFFTQKNIREQVGPADRKGCIAGNDLPAFHPGVFCSSPSLDYYV